VGAKLVLFGHTHRATSQVHRGILALNPGSISRPRGRDRPTFAVMEVPEVPDLRIDPRFFEVGAGVGGIREIEVI
jgi:predicted phosphodiesterase